MKKLISSMIVVGMAITGMSLTSCSQKVDAEPTLKEAFKDNFLMGVAVNADQVAGTDSIGKAIVAKHFNSIVAENVMKCEKIHPQENEYFWDDADAFVNFGEENNMFIIGHCLIWHSQLAPWFLFDDKGNYVDAETLQQRMRDHIYTIVGRYKGRVDAWDVVNEAILEDGSYRNSGFYEILGEEFIPLAFQYAHEADPDAELYYNDYGMHEQGRRDTVIKMVNDMKQRGLRIDGIGMQSHVGIDYPDFDAYEKSLEAFGGTGCKVMITEWDMSALPSVTHSANVGDTIAQAENQNPYPDGLPANVAQEWNDRMEMMMDMLVKHSDVVSRVTAWGLSDRDTWRNDWPIHGRTDYPLLFDRNHEMKPFLNKYLAQEKK